MSAKPTSPPAPDKSVTNKIIEALKAAGLKVMDCTKKTVRDGEIHTVRIFVKKDK